MNFSETSDTYGIYIEPRCFSSLFRRLLPLGNSKRVNETLGITVGRKLKPQATNFIKQILSFLAYGGSSIRKTLN
jgi:hypothetical protein